MEKTLSHLRQWFWCIAIAAVILLPSFQNVDYKSHAVSFAVLLLLLVEAISFIKKPAIAFSSLEIYLLLYVGWVCLSYFWSPSDLVASEYLGRFLPCVGLFLLVRQKSEESDRTPQMWVWMGFTLLVAIYGLLQKVGLDFIPVYAQSNSSTRIFATFGNPNFYAAFLVLTTLILLLNSFMSKKTLLKTTLCIGLLIIVLANLLFSGSRAGFLAFSVEFFLVLFLFGNQIYLEKKWRPRIIVFASLFLLAGGYMANKYGVRPTQRLELWKGAVQMFLDKPLQGWGIGQFSLNFPAYASPEVTTQMQKDNTFAEHVHNEILEMGVEVGLAGLLFAGLFWLKLVGRAAKEMFKKGERENKFSTPVIGLTTGFLGLGITNLFDYNCRLPGISFFLWFSAGLLANRVFPTDKIKLQTQVGLLIGILLMGGVGFGLFQEGRLLIAVLNENPQKEFLKGLPVDIASEQQRILENIKNQPINSANYHELGYLYVRIGKMDEAKHAFEKELELNPQSSGAYLNLGNIYLLTADNNPRSIEAARECYEKSIQLDPGSIEGHLNLAQVYFLHKDLKKALDELKKVLKIDPQNAQALSLKREILP